MVDHVDGNETPGGELGLGGEKRQLSYSTKFRHLKNKYILFHFNFNFFLSSLCLNLILILILYLSYRIVSYLHIRLGQREINPFARYSKYTRVFPCVRVALL